MENTFRIDRLRCICLICHKKTDTSILKSNDHCCNRKPYCKEKFTEIVDWERENLGQSLMYELSKVY